MRHYLQHVIRIFIVTLISGSSFAATLVPTAASVPGEVLVKIQASTSSEQIATLQNGTDVDQAEQIASVGSGAIWRMHSRSLSTADLATALQNSPNVVYVEPNYIVHALDTPNDTLYGQLWGMKNTGQAVGGVVGTAGADISAEAAWGVTTGS